MLKDQVVFWGEDPNILLSCADFFPLENMYLNQQLNALTRCLIVLTILIFIAFRDIKIILALGLTLSFIYFIHSQKQTEEETEVEGFRSPALDYLEENNIPISENPFQLPSSKNPFSNVLPTDYMNNPHKKPAAPTTEPIIKNDILNSAKQLVQEANPGQPEIADKLFKDLNEKLSFEQSLRPFNSNPSTTIPNDQGAFADFCYGSMVSCKEGNLFACARNLSNHQNI
jgi:hypothetical protein